MDCIWVSLKNVGPPFFKFISVYIKMSFKQLENHSQLFCGCDSENERTRFEKEAKGNSEMAYLTFRAHNLQNYLKQRDLAPLT